jgi:hypothetical protein
MSASGRAAAEKTTTPRLPRAHVWEKDVLEFFGSHLGGRPGQ